MKLDISFLIKLISQHRTIFAMTPSRTLKRKGCVWVFDGQNMMIVLNHCWHLASYASHSIDISTQSTNVIYISFIFFPPSSIFLLVKSIIKRGSNNKTNVIRCLNWQPTSTPPFWIDDNASFVNNSKTTQCGLRSMNHMYGTVNISCLDSCLCFVLFLFFVKKCLDGF